MKKHIYLLYRTEYGQLQQPIGENPRYKNQLRYHYFNSAFVEHKIILKQLFSSYRWYESLYGQLFEKVRKEELEWTSVIYFNRFSVWIARIFALMMKGYWYKINKVEIV